MLALTPQLVSAQLSVRPVQPKSDYFRFKAKYTVIATGEVVQFDLVRPCFVVSGRDATGDSIGLMPNKPSGYFNGVAKFPKVTSDHHAIVVGIPRGCDGETTANGKVPKSLLPFTTWFENADDLSYGQQYTHEDAYKSPFAKISFDGASEPADKSDFLAWQKHAADDFRPARLVQSPYGFSFELLNSSDDIADYCRGVKRLTLPDGIRELARSAWPDGHPRFWTVPPEKENRTPEQDALYRAIWTTENQRYRFNDDNSRSVLIWGLDVADGLQSVATRLDGALGRPWVRPPDFFPQTSEPYGLPFMTPERLAAPTLYFDIDVRPEKRGFTACYVETSAMSPSFKTQVPDAGQHDFRWRIDGQPVVGQRQLNPRNPNSPSRFFERDEFAYEQAWNPMQGQGGLISMYDDDFLQALGTWQRGWLEEPSKRAALAAELERQAAKLPERGRQVDQKCYRKRFLYKGDLTSIIVHGALDEGHTSWTLNRVYAQEFKGYHRDEAVTAAVFAHTPTPDEVLLNIVALWEDPTFRTALDDYVRRARPNADALLNFRANQGEVILKAPLRGDEIIGLTGIGAALDEICDRLGIIQAARPSIYRDLMGVEIYPGEPTWVWDDNAKGVFVRVREKFLGSRR